MVGRDINIVFLDSGTLSIGDIDFDQLKELGHVDFYERTEPSEVVTRAAEADIIIANKVLITEDILKQLNRLKYICVAATGYNNIDLKAAKSLNIPVSNVRGYSTNGVAQHVFALILDITHRVGAYNQQVSMGRWQSHPDFSFYDHSIIELKGLTLGLYGFGNIGRQVARLGLAFGMKVIAHHKHPERDAMEGVEFMSLEELAERADILSLHVPLNENNEGIIDYELLSLMKPSSVLVNTARGGLINEQELAEALEDKLIAFACLDVLSTEPPTMDNPLIEIPNCIITPHQAWASINSRQKLVDGLFTNIKSFVEGQEIKNRVV